MKRIGTRIIFVLVVVLGCSANLYATYLRYPHQPDYFPIFEAIIAVSLIATLAFRIRREQGWVFLTVISGLLLWHSIYWCIDKVESYKLVGNETWAGDGIGLLLEGMTLYPMILLLIAAVAASFVIAQKEKIASGTPI